MKFKIITLGCKVNTYESEYMLESLIASGYIYCEEDPDIIIVNTCSVTNMADSKSLKVVRRARRENPNSLILVCGCSSQNNPEKYQELGIDILLGNRKKSEIVALIEDYFKNNEKFIYFDKNRKLDFEDMQVKKFTTHTRAFLKIQDGCNNFCSYCVIPYVRGDVRSKDFTKTIKEVETLVNNNHKEIVLTGIHTGSYNSDGKDLSDLLIELSKIEELERIRISSIEITELDDKFLDVLKNNSKICDHLHIPLQSGSDNVLKKMNRKYDKKYYYEKIKKIREIRPDISITTDAIVGHPYETDLDFIEYLDFCREIAFSKIHVFPYSMRNGTAASLMPQVSNEIKKKRAHELIELSKTLEDDYIKRFIKTKQLVITEEYNGEYTIGFTSNYIKVYLKGEYLLNMEYLCVIEKVEKNIAYGVVLTCNTNKIGL